MGKKQPKINYRKKGKSYESAHSSKKSKRSNNYSKRNKKKFSDFLSNNTIQKNLQRKNISKIQVSEKKETMNRQDFKI